MLNRWQRTIVDLRGNVVPYAQLQVRVEATQAAASIYRDSAGTEAIPNGIVTANEQGYAYFYAPAGLYRITSAEPVIDWRDVNIGSAEALLRSNNLSDLSSASDARSNLGLGSAAVVDVVQGTGSSTTNVMSQKAVSDQLLGVGQTWRDVLNSRTAGTIYTNTTGRAIVVNAGAIDSADANATIIGYVNNTNVAHNTVTAPGGNGGVAFISFIVPSGASYRCNVGNGDSLHHWVELR